MTGFIGTVICVTKAASGPRRASNPLPRQAEKRCAQFNPEMKEAAD
jgi:hypothetical protein